MAKSSISVPQVRAPNGRPSRTVSVTYVPIDIGDPHMTRWNGVAFKANVPVELDPDNPDHYVIQLLPKTFPGTNGEVLTKHVEAKVFMGDMARTNPGFEVDGKKIRRKVSTRKVPPPGAEWTDAHEGQLSYSDEIDTGVAA
jgi:hypothetical protein